MKYPHFIKQNDCIGVPSPSAGAFDIKDQNKINNSKRKIEELGYQVKLSKNIYKCKKGRSASAQERAIEINEMFQDDNIDIIMCSNGGDFLIEILPYIDFDLIKNNPKLLIGFSDPTGLLYPITTKYDIATIYGHNFSSLGCEDWHQSHKDFLEIIKGNLITQKNYDMYEKYYRETITGLENYNLTEKVYWQILNAEEVCLKGRIIGGCMDIITELAGTKYDGINEFNEKYKDDGILWYFDNCELSKEDTIRTLWKMNELNYFKYTKGIIFGRFGTDVSYYGYDVKSCFEDSVLNDLNIPIIYEADISHKSPCLTIINGALATIDVKNGQGTIKFKLK